MNNISIEDVIKEITKYNPSEITRVKKAYELASYAHRNQKRESNEPYIIHPLNVCMNLTKFRADGATLCAGLLHDVVEDTDITLDEIKTQFGEEVAFLVEGVTKLSNMHFNNKVEETNANIRRLINSLNDDVRIIIIKLCDRLHNMQTLSYKAQDKQLRNAEETLHIFAPLAYFIGAFRLKCELEDLCLLYLKPESYQTLDTKIKEIELEYQDCSKKVIKDVKKALKENNISFTYRIKVFNIYQLYQKINKGYKLSDIHDLVNFKLVIPDNEDPYRVLGIIHKLYTPMNYKFKDYIASPKTNMYRSLHTTVFAPDNHLIQFQIKTQTMDEINTYGLAAYWKFYKGQGKLKMQQELKVNYQFFNTIRDLNAVVDNDSDFISRVKQEIFSNNIYVYTVNGDIIELPNGSTIIDFAYKLHTDFGNHLYKAYINGKEVKLYHKLNNKDRIMLLQKNTAHPRYSWLDYVVTSKAKKSIKEYFK